MYFLKEKILWNQWGSNMGIPIHMLFFSRRLDVCVCVSDFHFSNLDNS